MMNNGWLQLGFLLIVLLPVARPLGHYLTGVFTSARIPVMHRIVGPVERLIYRCGGVNREQNQTWLGYAMACLLFNFLGFLFLYVLQLCQAYLSLNPAHQASVPAPLAFNTAASFVTNTNWQNYSGKPR